MKIEDPNDQTDDYFELTLNIAFNMSKNRYSTSPTVCAEESTGASSPDEYDILQQTVCRKALRRLSMGSTVISEGTSILDDGFNRVVPTGKQASEYTYNHFSSTPALVTFFSLVTINR